MHEKYQEILGRLRSLELRQSATSRPVSRGSTESSDRPSSETQSQQGEGNHEGKESQKRKTFSFKFEKDLAITRVYRRFFFSGSSSSLVTTEEEPKSKWSMLSASSMADMTSQISVLNLAISAHDVYNSDQYTEKNLDKVLDEMRNRDQTDELLLSQRHFEMQEDRIRSIERHLFAEKQLTATLEEALGDLESQGNKVKMDMEAWKKKAWAYEKELGQLKRARGRMRRSLPAVEE